MVKNIFICFLFTLCSFISYAQWIQIGSNINGEAQKDGSGHSIALNANGNRIAIGAPNNHGGTDRAGHTRVYEWDGTNWTQIGMDIDGEHILDGSGHSIALSADGNRVAIGAPWNDANGNDAGHTRVYEWDGTNWTQIGMDIDGEAKDDGFGYAVDLSADGNRVAIGAPFNDNIISATGHTRVYEWDGTNWTQIGMDINGEKHADLLGWSVSLNADGNRIAIGATTAIYSSSEHGFVKIYEWNGTNWTQIGNRIIGEEYDDLSGHSVDLSADGNRVAIGAPFNDANGYDAGQVRIYEWTENNWIKLGMDIDGKAAFDNFGFSVAISADGTKVIVGAPFFDDEITYGVGQVRIYEWIENNWIKLNPDINGAKTLDYSGSSVSINADGTIISISSPGNDDIAFQAGNVKIYTIFQHDETATIPTLGEWNLIILTFSILIFGIIALRNTYIIQHYN